MAAQPICKRCNSSDNVKLRKQYAVNGAEQFTWYCTACNRIADNQTPFVKKEKVQAWVQAGKLPSLECVPVANDYRNNAVCEVCGQPGGEYHHWLPQCFHDDVPDAGRWPGAMLCKSCHDLWHETVTPFLPGRGKTEAGQRTIGRYMRKANNGH